MLTGTDWLRLAVWWLPFWLVIEVKTWPMPDDERARFIWRWGLLWLLLGLLLGV